MFTATVYFDVTTYSGIRSKVSVQVSDENFEVLPHLAVCYFNGDGGDVTNYSDIDFKIVNQDNKEDTLYMMTSMVMARHGYFHQCSKLTNKEGIAMD